MNPFLKFFVASSVAEQLNVKPCGLCSICKKWNDPRYAFKMAIDTNENFENKTRLHWVFTESGFYRYISRSRSELGQKLANWVTIDVLPSIRKKKRKLAKLNKRLGKSLDNNRALKKDNANLENTVQCLRENGDAPQQMISDLENKREEIEKEDSATETQSNELQVEKGGRGPLTRQGF